jgi:hypothetical protein
MRNNRNFLKVLAASSTAAALLIVLGCSSDDGLGSRYSVSGTVTYKGSPLAKGTIGFTPEDQALRGASGEINNGSYSLTTQAPGDGALPGKYKVSIASKEDADVEVAKNLLRNDLKKKGVDASQMPPIVPPEYMMKAAKNVKSLIPVKYASPNTSKLSATVEARSNTIDFTLED